MIATRNLIAGAVIAGFLPTFAAADPPTYPAQTAARFSAIPKPSDPKGIWLLDTFTGALARCESGETNTLPACSLWAPGPSEQPRATHRYNPATGQIEPIK
jgi:hypothetical protein